MVGVSACYHPDAPLDTTRGCEMIARRNCSQASKRREQARRTIIKKQIQSLLAFYALLPSEPFFNRE